MGGIGDGGIITTNKQKNYKRIKLLRNYGHNKEGITILNGRNSRLDTIQAIILNQRLKKLNSENLKRIKIAKMYDIKLKTSNQTTFIKTKFIKCIPSIRNKSESEYKR